MDITNNTKLFLARVVLLVLLFQLFTPSISVAVTKTNNDGYFSQVCTLQGFKQIWIQADNQDNQGSLIVSDCPYCLLSIFEVDAIEQTTQFFSIPVNKVFENTKVVQSSIHRDAKLKIFAIRAPPYIS